MVFTIGSMREMRQQRTGVRNAARVAALAGVRNSARRRTRAGVCLNVAEYTGLCGWAVVPGARVARGGSDCSCGNSGCAEPGAHPLAFAGEIPAGTAMEAATEAWARVPGAAVLLPVGGSFDIIDVAEATGRRALVRLERMGLRLGPVLLTPAGRAQFFVAPGAAAELPICSTGWAGTTRSSTCAAWAPVTTSPRRPPTWAVSARSTGSASPASTRCSSRPRPACSSAPWRTSATGTRRTPEDARGAPPYGRAPLPPARNRLAAPGSVRPTPR